MDKTPQLAAYHSSSVETLKRIQSERAALEQLQLDSSAKEIKVEGGYLIPFTGYLLVTDNHAREYTVETITSAL